MLVRSPGFAIAKGSTEQVFNFWTTHEILSHLKVNTVATAGHTHEEAVKQLVEWNKGGSVFTMLLVY